jgi:3-methyladenine DNA glycosylase AlkC
MLAGSEAMVASLPISHSIKIAAKSTAPGAEVIYNNMKGLIPQFKRKSVNSTEVATTA